ncbi:MAG: glycine oxidase ThiO [Pyrinomonadaceae bacterium]
MYELPKTANAIIIGGGVIGLAVSRALALRGVNDVVLIERGSLGTESSSAAAGMLAPQAEADHADLFFKLCCRSRDMYVAFAEDLREETGIDVELDTTGTLYLAFKEHDQDEIERRHQWQTRAGLPVEKLSATDARKLEPGISEHTRAALKFPLDIQVENRRLLSALATSNEKLGVRLATGVTVESIQVSRNRVEGVQTSRGLVAAPYVIVAGGAWTSFIGGSDQPLPKLSIEPVRGQMLSFETNPSIASHVIYSPRGYIVPRRNGRLLAGSTTEQSGFDKRVTAAGVHSILSHALEITARIAVLPLVDSWAGLRPRAPDNLPVLGPYDGIEGLIYATGHYRNGILLAPITAELIAGVIVDNVVSELLGPFAPDRFETVSAT